MKKAIALLLFLLPLYGNAAVITPIQESFIEKAVRCHVWIPCYFEQKFGATVTTIAGSDTLSSSRTTINNNFSNINTELLTIVGTTTNSTITTLSGLTTASALATVGTITSGTWSGTTIGVAKGGTNLTSYTAGDILYATGATTLAKLGIGGIGEVLTVSGSTLPSWSSVSVNQTLAYAWTGVHNFAGSATYVKALTASSTINIDNGGSNYAITLPTTNTNSNLFSNSSILQNNGLGTLTWAGVTQAFGTTTNAFSSSATASTTVFSYTVPANTLGIGNSIVIDLPINNFQLNGTSPYVWFDVAYGTGSTTQAFSGSGSFDTGSTAGSAKIILQGAGTTGTQKLTFSLATVATGANNTGVASITGSKTTSISQDSTAAKTLIMVMRYTSAPNGAFEINQSVGRINR